MKNILALAADIANGLFATILACVLTGVEPSWWYFAVGIALAMSPDLDALPELIKRGKVSASATSEGDHRELFHFPIFFLLLGLGILYFSLFWGLLFLFAVILHFINDFYGTGWGIPIFWPLTSTRYKLLGRKANLLKSILQEKGTWKTLTYDERRLRLIVSWETDELPIYIRKYGIDDWINRYYLRLNWISALEYCLFAFAVVTVWILYV